MHPAGSQDDFLAVDFTGNERVRAQILMAGDHGRMPLVDQADILGPNAQFEAVALDAGKQDRPGGLESASGYSVLRSSAARKLATASSWKPSACSEMPRLLKASA